MGPSWGVFQDVVFMLPFGSCSALLIVCVRQRTGLWWWLRCTSVVVVSLCTGIVFDRSRTRISVRKLILVKVLCNVPQSIPGNIYLCHSRFLPIHQSDNDPNNRIYPTNSVGKASSYILQNDKHKTSRYRILTTQLGISIALIGTFFKHMLKQRTPETKTRSLPSSGSHTPCPLT